ncbi:hypothetical protein N658DRAFT_508781 [Parathielavia hyrcaniae]|uniref:Uncharacterized protein n=1 Tax=Parathielavia hyrcaniae TaxID=113614 RepID=A0AAN6Q1L6_9PEZI|nr:hypothetical protein N658DRAFT_508781 [Parathielavia hyrcaniae]
MTLPARPRPRVSSATDILQDPARSALPRYAAYRRARARFWEAFPEGGAYARLPTPGTDLECGLHALALSMRHQLPGMVDRVATVEELRGVFEDEYGVGSGSGSGSGVGGCRDGEGGLDGVDLGNYTFSSDGSGARRAGWFTADQLAAVFSAWGRRYLNRDGQGRVRCQLGWVTDRDEDEGEEGWPVMMNTSEVDTPEVGEGIVRVWVWNDGASLRGGIGHFEGIRRPTEQELEGLDR